MPAFTHKLTFSEQRALPPEQVAAYCDFILSRPLRDRRFGEDYLAGDYAAVGTRQAYDWGE